MAAANDPRIVLGTNAGIAAKYFSGEDSVGSLALVVRACRIGRVMRLMQGAESMRQLFDTLLIEVHINMLSCMFAFSK